MKQLSRLIEKCTDCPFFNYDYRGCSETDDIVPLDVSLPDWCPLPEVRIPSGRIDEALEGELQDIAESGDLG